MIILIIYFPSGSAPENPRVEHDAERGRRTQPKALGENQETTNGGEEQVEGA